MMVLDVNANLHPHVFSHAGSMFLMSRMRFLCCFLLMAIFSRLPWGTTGGLSFVDDDRLLLATDGVVNHDPIPVFLIHMAAQRIAGVAVVDI
jgi:hypothetical protein